MLNTGLSIIFKGKLSPSWDTSHMLESIEELIFKVRSDRKRREEGANIKSRSHVNKKSVKIRS